jgi:Uma2 family endonuclease
MKQALEKYGDRRFTHQAVTWQQFKTLQSAFNEISGLRLMYCEGVLEIMGIGIQHETIVTLLCGLLMTYFLGERIDFVSTGAYSQIVETKTEFQSDLSFSFSGNKEITDLCVEVVITSGGVEKLNKYLLRSIPEVWFWEDGKIAVYLLQNGAYLPVDRSSFLPNLDLSHLEECLLMDSHLEAMLFFKQKYI